MWTLFKSISNVNSHVELRIMSLWDESFLWEEAYVAWEEVDPFWEEEDEPHEKPESLEDDDALEKNKSEVYNGAQDNNCVPEYDEAQQGSNIDAIPVYRAEVYPRSASAPPILLEPTSTVSPSILPATPLPQGIITPSTPSVFPRQEPYGLAIEHYEVIARNLVLPSITIHDFIQLMGGSPHRHGLRIWIQITSWIPIKLGQRRILFFSTPRSRT